MQRPPWFDFDRLHGRLFEKGDLKYVILQLLSERSAHGYEVIRALEERFGGMYTPSAGAVYPTLQMLEDMEYVSSTQQDGKKSLLHHRRRTELPRRAKGSRRQHPEAHQLLVEPATCEPNCTT